MTVPEDRELWTLIRSYVTPGRRYLELLHGNFLHRGRWQRFRFLRSLRADSRRISDAELRILLSSEWRSRLTAAWLIGASGREQFIDELGSLFTQSALVYSGQGYAVALAAIGGPDSAEQLERYLSQWLPHTDKRYDQAWAMAALAYLDSVAGTHRAARFTACGAWQDWAQDRTELATMTFLVHDLVTAIGRA